MVENSNRQDILRVIEKSEAIKNKNPQGDLKSENQTKRAMGKEKDMWENWSKMD